MKLPEQIDQREIGKLPPLRAWIFCTDDRGVCRRGMGKVFVADVAQHPVQHQRAGIFIERNAQRAGQRCDIADINPIENRLPRFGKNKSSDAAKAVDAGDAACVTLTLAPM